MRYKWNWILASYRYLSVENLYVLKILSLASVVWNCGFLHLLTIGNVQSCFWHNCVLNFEMFKMTATVKWVFCWLFMGQINFIEWVDCSFTWEGKGQEYFKRQQLKSQKAILFLKWTMRKSMFTSYFANPQISFLGSKHPNFKLFFFWRKGESEYQHCNSMYACLIRSTFC